MAEAGTVRTVEKTPILQENVQSVLLPARPALTKERGKLMILTDPSSRSLLTDQRNFLAEYTRKSIQICRQDPSRFNAAVASTKKSIVSSTIDLTNGPNENGPSPEVFTPPTTPIQRGSTQAFLSPSILQDRSDNNAAVEISPLDDELNNVDELCARFHRLLTTGHSDSYDIPALGVAAGHRDQGQYDSCNTNGRHVDDNVPDTASFNVAAVEAAMARFQLPFTSTLDSGVTPTETAHVAAKTPPPSYYYQVLWTSTAQAASGVAGIINNDDPAAISGTFESPVRATYGWDTNLGNTLLSPASPSIPFPATSHRPEPSPTTDIPSPAASSSRPFMMEVAPGLFMSLKGVNETWRAIKVGKITITSCIQCQQDLTCVEDLTLVVCGDCWTVSPVNQSYSCLNLNTAGDDGSSRTNSSENIHGSAKMEFVGLGVKNHEVMAWMENGCRESFAMS